MLQGIRAAFDFSHDEEWFRFMSSFTGICHRKLKQAIAQVVLIHNIMSTYTAIIAVASLTHTTGQFGMTVPVSEGVVYETTVIN